MIRRTPFTSVQFNSVQFSSIHRRTLINTLALLTAASCWIERTMVALTCSEEGDWLEEPKIAILLVFFFFFFFFVGGTVYDDMRLN